MDLLPWTVLNKPGDIREAKYIICTRAFACLVKKRFFFFGRNLRAAPLIKKDCSLGFYCLASSYRIPWLHPAPLETASFQDTEKPTMAVS